MPRRFHAYRFFYERPASEVQPGVRWPLGAMLVEIGEIEAGFADLVFRHDTERLLDLDPDADLEYLAALETDIRQLLASRDIEEIGSKGPTSRRAWIISQIENNFSNLITVSDPIIIEIESPEDELQKLLVAESDAHGG
jgi:hypothetical protein